MLLSIPLILYVLSSNDEVCSFKGCWVPESCRRGSDSTMILLVSAKTQYRTEVRATHSKSNSLSAEYASFSKQKVYSPI